MCVRLRQLVARAHACYYTLYICLTRIFIYRNLTHEHDNIHISYLTIIVINKKSRDRRRLIIIIKRDESFLCKCVVNLSKESNLGLRVAMCLIYIKKTLKNKAADCISTNQLAWITNRVYEYIGYVLSKLGLKLVFSIFILYFSVVNLSVSPNKLPSGEFFLEGRIPDLMNEKPSDLRNAWIICYSW